MGKDLSKNSETANELDWRQRLYQAKAAELLLYGRALGLSHAEAEDILQETFLGLMQQTAPPKEPVYYCLRSFRNRTRNYRRNLWRRIRREMESARWFESEGGESPQERAALRELMTLPAEQREVIVLKVWHRMTFEEIGRVLEISPNTAAGRYRYGIGKLKRFLLDDGAYERLESIGGTFAVLEAAPTLSPD